MEYCGGGDLLGLLIKKDILSPKDTRFYMAELAVAINHVHRLHYVHRDLKPDNVLIGNDGHIRLSDFGLAKMNLKGDSRNQFQVSNKEANSWTKYVQTVNKEQFAHLIQEYEKAMDDEAEDAKKQKDEKKKDDDDVFEGDAKDDDAKDDSAPTPAVARAIRHKKVYSTVGTPDYIALEVLHQKGYNHMVDWWSLGVIMFECLVGYAPFDANDQLATFRKIIRFEKYFQVPNELVGKQVPNTARDLMHKLVTQVSKRLDFAKIQKHVFFKVELFVLLLLLLLLYYIFFFFGFFSFRMYHGIK